MTDLQGRFVWYDLITTNVESAKAFYGKVAGWGTKAGYRADRPYTLFTAGETIIGGLISLPEEAAKVGARPMWIGYVGANDVDAVAEQAKAQNSMILGPPTDYTRVGRTAILSDPQRAILGFVNPSASGDIPSPAESEGRFAWHELITPDREKAFEFYRPFTGWRKADAYEMGELGTYQLFSAGDHMSGGMFNKPPHVPHPHWLYYIHVGDIDAAALRVTTGGGQILHGPVQVPGGAWVVQFLDPQGVPVAMKGTDVNAA